MLPSLFTETSNLITAPRTENSRALCVCVCVCYNHSTHTHTSWHPLEHVSWPVALVSKRLKVNLSLTAWGNRITCLTTIIYWLRCVYVLYDRASCNLTFDLTCIKKHAHSTWVVSEYGIMKRCAAAETGPSAETITELVLSGNHHWEWETEMRREDLIIHYYRIH